MDIQKATAVAAIDDRTAVPKTALTSVVNLTSAEIAAGGIQMLQINIDGVPYSAINIEGGMKK